MPQQSTEAMRQLVDRINEASQKYYVEDAPIMSDAQWDALYDQLRKMEEATGVRLPDSPTLRVGGEPLAAFRPHRHLAPLWSMDKVQSEAELLQWLARARTLHAKLADVPPLTFAVEYKFDGLTINLTYDEGLLRHAATRGNGTVGEEILPQARTIQEIPLAITHRGKMEIHGECFMRLSAFREYNKTAAEPLKNARNGAAGALRNLDPKVTALRKLSALFYEIGFIEDAPYADQQGMVEFMRRNGFPLSPLLYVGDDPQQILAAIRGVEAKRHELDFLIDGAVIKVTDKRTRQLMGYTDKFPRWAVAYKFSAEENTTILREVTWEVGRTGKITPLGHVEAVDFSGVTVKRATLNNWGDIRRKQLAKGINVWIRRSNDVIPEITGRVEDGITGDEIVKPTHCPACGTPLVERGANLFCPNRLGCKPQAIGRLVLYAARDALDITTFSEKTAELLYDQLGVRQPGDLYRLSREQLLQLEGFQDKRAQNLLDAVAASKAPALDAFIYALGIPNIGRATARDLAQHFVTLEHLRRANTEQLIQVGQIGDVIATSIVEFFTDPFNSTMVDELLHSGVTPQSPQAEQSAGMQALAGKTVVVTGTLEGLSRQEAEDLIRAHGGIAASAVSRKTAFVLAGENAGSKLARAQELGVPVYTQAEFMQMIK